MRVILASGSPRRREILSNLGVKFEIITADTDENCDILQPEKLVCELAKRKGRDVAQKVNDNSALIISADTVVALDGEILGKPENQQEAKRMLKKLSGRSHSVLTGVSLNYNGKELTEYETTKVYFSKLTDVQIDMYISTNEPSDKAGAYAIQGMASLWIDKIDGCYFNVVGFPTRLFYKMLEKLDIDIKKLG